jgi:hypothetical protein
MTVAKKAQPTHGRGMQSGRSAGGSATKRAVPDSASPSKQQGKAGKARMGGKGSPPDSGRPNENH